MQDNGYNLLDTKAFDRAIEMKEGLLTEYDAINSEYDRIVKTLLGEWEGMGADAFRDDATKVKTNITGIDDILKMMCDTLTDCRDIFREADLALGNFNRNPQA